MDRERFDTVVKRLGQLRTEEEQLRKELDAIRDACDHKHPNGDCAIDDDPDLGRWCHICSREPK